MRARGEAVLVTSVGSAAGAPAAAAALACAGSGQGAGLLVELAERRAPRRRWSLRRRPVRSSRGWRHICPMRRWPREAGSATWRCPPTPPESRGRARPCRCRARPSASSCCRPPCSGQRSSAAGSRPRRSWSEPTWSAIARWSRCGPRAARARAAGLRAQGAARLAPLPCRPLRPSGPRQRRGAAGPRGETVPLSDPEQGQALPLALGGCLVLILGALALVAIAGAVTGKGRAQRAADLAAISAARSMRDDLPRLLSPPVLPNGLPNPAHMEKAVYLWRARLAAHAAAIANGVGLTRLRVSFPDLISFAPVRARAVILARLEVGGGRTRVEASAVAEAAAPAASARLVAGDRQRRRLLRPARLSQRRGNAARRRRRLRPDGRRGLTRRPRPAGQLGVPLRRRTGRALRRQPGSALGRPAGAVAAPLRDRARPRPRIGLRLARRQRRRLRLRRALLVGAVALRLRRLARSRAPPRATRSVPGGGDGATAGGGAACPASSRRSSASPCCGPPHAGTSRRPCSPRS